MSAKAVKITNVDMARYMAQTNTRRGVTSNMKYKNVAIMTDADPD
ncbi:DNA topoisomerase II [Aeromonas phage AS-gz]|jgi:DNA gyrase/topoisomerase IV subunit B|nr:DNA topoisomerase II [Aeromonas phage AS-gz]YP_010095593.1 DNA topoisomerase II [Aeromonas phage 50AhydR13PP]YP_010095883.1 DNA topoisomerase II [Aeromonas phage 60AhydR15PP]ASU00644.1 topoisomerase II large subunit [Aeromonas phage AS-gz]AWH14857.1 topoisomerase II large subunit [Aeromonas phage 50AhydR13PP]AWH15679.1 topoisomerase II large subunit [Aeromonas phage 60AhydR15PP]